MIISFRSLAVALVVCSFAYMAKLTSVSPVYITLPLLFVVLIVSFRRLKGNHLKLSGFLSIIYLMYIFTFTPFAGEMSTYVNLVLSLLVFIGLQVIFLNTSVSAKHVYDKSLFFLLPLFIIESLLRILNPEAPTEAMGQILVEQNKTFYLYKFNSFMFSDSNTTALCLLSLLFCKLALVDFKFTLLSKFEKAVVFIILCLVILTFSRAAILATFFTFVIIALRKYLLFIIAPLLFVFLYVISGVVDESLIAKFHVISSFFNIVTSSGYDDIIFGYGIGQSENVLGYPPHVFLITLFVELGMVGSLFSFIIFLSILREGKINAVLFSLPLFITSLSYFLYIATPFVFATFSIILSKNYERNSLLHDTSVK
jgi:hypothetical protein